MSSIGQVSQWVMQLKGGDQAAVQGIWEVYFQRLVVLARKKLHAAPRRAADEEDVALSAFDSFCRGAQAGRFPKLLDREDLWQLLVVLTARKAHKLVRHEGCQKRGGGKVQPVSVLAGDDASGQEQPFAQIIGREPTPEFAAQVAEECQRLLDKLGDDELRMLALWKMEGYTSAEVAAKLGRSEPTVERKMRLIRNCWEKEQVP
jgi:DNA-directed RNA polymerase specialized sigma24 family protein